MDKKERPHRYDPLLNAPDTTVDDFGRGQLLALMTVVDVLVQTHPDSKRLSAVYTDAFNRLMAATLPSMVSDEYIEGVHEVHSRVAPLLGMVDG